MDLQKIGSFLKELRKQNHMTQEQLGERIGVTNKTISRWETGNYMPPAESLMLLSEIYQVSINEILAGKILDEKEYREASEDNISATLEKLELEGKRFENRMLLILGLTTAIAIAILLLLPEEGSLTAAGKIRELAVIVLVWAMAAISNTMNIVALALHKKAR